MPSSRQYFEHADQAVVKACYDAVHTMQDMGAELIPIKIPELESARVAHVAARVFPDATQLPATPRGCNRPGSSAANYLHCCCRLVSSAQRCTTSTLTSRSVTLASGSGWDWMCRFAY